MGIYWKPVNLDKKQQVHPHRVGDGLKWGEWAEHPESATHRTVQRLLEKNIWAATDELRILSDAGGSVHLHGPVTDREADYDDEWEDAHDLAPICESDNGA